MASTSFSDLPECGLCMTIARWGIDKVPSLLTGNEPESPVSLDLGCMAQPLAYYTSPCYSINMDYQHEQQTVRLIVYHIICPRVAQRRTRRGLHFWLVDTV